MDSIGGGTPTPPPLPTRAFFAEKLIRQLLAVDMHMPGMDWFDSAQQVPSRPDLRASLIMMLTFAGHRRDAERCKALGVATYLLKSIRQSELREAIARILGANEQQGAIPFVTRYSLRDARHTEEVLSVLLAEGNLVNQRLSTRLLEKRGHHVKVVHNGREALDTLDGTDFDLVLMDIQMPEMDGLTAVVKLREKKPFSRKHQSVIALTAHALRKDEDRCLRPGWMVI